MNGNPAALLRAIDEAEPPATTVPSSNCAPEGDGSSGKVQFFKCTDTGNAERLVTSYSKEIRYCGPWKSWLVWDGRRWKRDDRGRIHHLAKLTVRDIYKEAARCTDSDIRKAVGEWAKKSESRDKRAAMVSLAQSEPKIAVHFSDFDCDPMLLNVENGTIDLHTGELRPHQRKDMITKLAPVKYDPEASSPQWEKFLTEVLPDPEVRTFLQRFAGCCLSGDVADRVFVFLSGKGRNGKSVFLRVLRSMLGEFAIVAAPDLLMAKRGETAHPTELADLFGARLAVCQEVPKNRAFNEQRVKELTGNEGAIKARRMNENFWEFVPTFKLAIAGNHEPRVNDDTDAIWDRMRKVPFNVRIADDKVDKDLFEKLRKEFPGILAWAVRGCLDWRQNGLPAPKPVAAATDAYRATEDVIGRFFADCCIFYPGARATTKDLVNACNEWCEANGEKSKIGRKDLTDRLKKEGCSERRTNKARGWQGIRLLDPAEIKARDEASDEVTEGDVTSGVRSRETMDLSTAALTASPSVTLSLPTHETGHEHQTEAQ